MWVTRISSTRYYTSTLEGMKIEMEGNEHDGCGPGKERYAALCAGCEDSKRNVTRTLISSCCTV